MRTFIAVQLEPHVKRPVIQLLRTFPRAAGVRWCSEPQLHVTLKFLGDVPTGDLPRVCDLAAQVGRQVAPFPITLAGLGCFPGPRNPRVLWLGLDDPERGCQRWVERADPLLEQLGYKPETRAFTPHITLGRSQSTPGSEALRRVLAGASAPPAATMTVRQAIVYESILGPGGARHQELATAPLGGA
jgi:2'-5' RNA ligase